MAEYEILFLIGESKKGEIDRIKAEVESVIVAEGGEMQAGEFVDERRMEYTIRRERRGVYVARRFAVKEGAGDVTSALSKKLLLMADVLRFIVVRAEDLPTLEESQERVKRIPSEARRRGQSRGSYDRSRSSRPATVSAAAPVSAVDTAKPVISDTEIDKKLDEVLNI